MKIEEIFGALLIFSLVILVAVAMYSSSAHNYAGIMQTPNSSSFSALAEPILPNLTSDMGTVKTNIIDGEITANNEQGSILKSGYEAVKTIWNSGNIISGVLGGVTFELSKRFGGEDTASQQLLVNIKNIFLVLIAFFILMTVAYFISKWQPS